MFHFCSNESVIKERNQQGETVFSGDKFSDLDLSAFMVRNYVFVHVLRTQKSADFTCTCEVPKISFMQCVHCLFLVLQ